MPNVLISELDLSPAVVGTDIFLIQHASGAPAEHCTAAQMAVYVAASGTTYFAGTALSLATTNTFNVTTVPIANGGSGQTTASNAFDALAPTTSSGDMIYRTAASGGNVRLAIGSPGQVLGISSGLPAWTTVAGVGTVTSVDVSGGGTGITYSGGPITAAGTITASGTLGLDYGGTSATTAIAAFNALAPTTASGDTIYRTSTGNVRLAIGSSGQVLTASGGIPVWISPSSSGTVNYVDVSGGGTGLSFDGGPITASGTITATGTLNAAAGGTGNSFYTVGDLLYASTTTTLAKLADTATGNVLISGGVGVAPSWGKLDLANGATGILDVGYGGTSATTAIAAFGALAPTTTQGDLIYYFGTSNTRLAIGSSGQVLTSSGGLPVWSANNGTVNYVDVSGGNTGLTFNGGPVTASGTITASGTLVVSAGGTGAATLTGVLKGTGTTAVVAATAGTDYVSPIVATNFTAQQTFAGATNILAAVFTNAAEVVTVATLAATGTVNYDITSQSVLYYTDVSTANFIPNFRGSSGNTLTSILATGQAVSAVWAVTMGTTAFYSTAVQVDGSTAGVTLKWQGGAAPTAGNASSVDAYNYTIIKTASESFTVLAAQTQFA
jgi:hypothetical protein